MAAQATMTINPVTSARLSAKRQTRAFLA